MSLTSENRINLPGPVATDRRALFVCTLAALTVEFVLLTAVAWYNHWLSHPQKTTGLDESKFIEAQMFELPKEAAHLSQEKPVSAARPESVISKVAGAGRKAKPGEKTLEDQNQATQGNTPVAAPTHGPIAVYTPSPAIPTYLQNQNLNTSVVIEFLVSSQASVSPRLLSSSGNEELDAIALTTAKLWQFRPAERDHKPIDSKVRLRILFEVK
jgi:TonB family protein